MVLAMIIAITPTLIVMVMNMQDRQVSLKPTGSTLTSMMGTLGHGLKSEPIGEHLNVHPSLFTIGF
jgi:hypothetical protein